VRAACYCVAWMADEGSPSHDEQRYTKPKRARQTRAGGTDEGFELRSNPRCIKGRTRSQFSFSFSLGVRLNPFEPSRPKSQSWNRVQSCAFVAYETEMPSFRLGERRCLLLRRGRSPDQVSFCSLGWPNGTGYYIKGELSPLRC
jgi:hypothetical protein